MELDPVTLSGRLLLLQGPAWNGKTGAVRALADAWRGWCRVDYVLDHGRLLGDPGYLMDVAVGLDSGDDDDDAEKCEWRLQVLETATS